MKIIDFEKVEPQLSPHGIELRKFPVNGKAVIVAKLKPGDKIDKHTAEGDAFFFILEGTGVFMYDENEITVGSETLIECPGTTERGWRNESDQVLRFLVIKDN